MSLIFVQTNISSVCLQEAFCSGASVGADEEYNRRADVGGTPGTVEVSVSIDPSAADRAAGWYV